MLQPAAKPVIVFVLSTLTKEGKLVSKSCFESRRKVQGEVVRALLLGESQPKKSDNNLFGVFLSSALG